MIYPELHLEFSLPQIWFNDTNSFDDEGQPLDQPIFILETDADSSMEMFMNFTRMMYYAREDGFEDGYIAGLADGKAETELGEDEID